jgi:hypothetical protein
MTLTSFAVVHAREGDAFGDPLVHCHAKKQLVLAYIAREALEDYFRIPGDQHVTLAQWNLVVDRNLDAFAKIIAAKYERDDWSIHNAYGQSYPRMIVTLDDMNSSGETFTADVHKLKAGFQRPAGS